jgi:uncharacterized LabA/DUF88 family protein
MFYKDERIALFIDGISIYTTAKILNMDIDYKLLREEFMRRGKLVRAFYYTALPDTDDVNPLRPLVDYLSYNGYRTVTKYVREYTDEVGNRRMKNNMDVELAVDAMEMADTIDHAIIFSGDGSLLPAVEALQRKGVRVSVVSTVSTSHSRTPVVADKLRRQADNFIDLENLRSVIARPPRCEAAE